MAALPSNLTAVTVSLNARFLKPASVGTITARARIIEHAGREMAVEADLLDAQGVTVADATARLRILQKR